jgi:homospermidine synthase
LFSIHLRLVFVRCAVGKDAVSKVFAVNLLDIGGRGVVVALAVKLSGVERQGSTGCGIVKVLFPTTETSP